MLFKKYRERATLTTVKHMDVFLEQEKGYMREHETGEYYFLEAGRELAPQGRWIRMTSHRCPDHRALVEKDRASCCVVS